MDLDFWDCFGRKKTPSYKRRNTVAVLPLYLNLYTFILEWQMAEWLEMLGYGAKGCKFKLQPGQQ